MARVRWSSLGACLLALSCGTEFEKPSSLDSLRVLAVQKDKPYAVPGDTVTLRMLLTDASEDGPRQVNVLWLAGCENPLGDLYAGCFVSFAEGGASAIVPGAGLEFSFRLSPDIISGRPPPPDPKQPRYGLSIVFFAACAGEIKIEESVDPENPSFPIYCESPSGERLGADSFVAGYTQIFAYDGFTNANPIVTGFEFDEDPLTPECIGPGCMRLQAAELGGGAPLPPPPDAGAADGGPGDGGAPDGGVGGGAQRNPCDLPKADAFGNKLPRPGCIKVCPEDKKSTECPLYQMKLVVSEASAEHSTVIEAREGSSDVLEQMWINYYTDGNRIDRDVKLLNDTVEGWNEDHGTEIRAPKEAGPFHVWAVAHDNRGGAEWARVLLGAE